MRSKSNKKARQRPYQLTRAERGVERRQNRKEYREPRLRDPSSGGAYFMNQVERLRSLAGALAPLMQDLYDQANDLRWELKTIEDFIEEQRTIEREQTIASE